MGGFSCCVKGCKSSGYVKKSQKYFSLPCTSEDRRLWIKLIGYEKEEEIPKSARVCSDHFPASFHTWTCKRLALQSTACGCSPKGLLPSLKLPQASVNTDLLCEVQSHLNTKRKEYDERNKSLPAPKRSCSNTEQAQACALSGYADGETYYAEFPSHAGIQQQHSDQTVQNFHQEVVYQPVADNNGSDAELPHAQGSPTATNTAGLMTFSHSTPKRSNFSRERFSSVAASPQKIRAQKIVDLVLVQSPRVPPHVLPVNVAESAGLSYASLSNTELVQLLIQRDEQLEVLRRDAEHQKQSFEAHELELSQFKKLQAENQSLKSTLATIVEKNKSLHQRLKDAWREGKECGLKEASSILEDIFSSTQLQVIMTKKRVVWTPEDLSSAAALHACSAKAYRFIRKVMKIPLASESTIQRWAAKMKISPGLQNKVVSVLEKLGKDMKESERLVVFSFDEIQISQRVQYDQARDAVLGPHSHAQVVFIRSLTENWKQPIYYQFDENMNKEVFDNIATSLFNIGFTVVASVCDLGPSNQTFLRSLGVYESEKSSYPHPSDKKLSIFFLADCPHMLKLFRNHILDQGLNLPTGQFRVGILKTTIDLINRRELRAADKLHAGLLELNSKARMRVRPAAQLLSGTMSTAINYLAEKGILKDRDSLLVAEVVTTINNWFDTTNSRASAKEADGKLKQPFGSQLKDQEEALVKMNALVSNMRVKGHKSMLPFQHGILMSNLSIVALHKYLKERYGVDQFPTSRANQDCVEGFFAWIRASGVTYTCPTALDFSYRFRKYLVSKSTFHFAENSNCEEEEDVSNICADSLIKYVPETSMDEGQLLTNQISNRNSEGEDSEGLEEHFDTSEEESDDSCDIDDSGGHMMHHRSKKLRALADTLTRKNGIISMACLLASKCDVQESAHEEQPDINFSILTETEKEKLKNRKWLISLTSSMEKTFLSFHGPSLADFNRAEDVNKTLCEKIVLKYNCDPAIAKLFVQTRLSMRIRDFNMPLRNASLNCTNKSYSKYYS